MSLRNGDAYLVMRDEMRDGTTTLWAYDEADSNWLFMGNWAADAGVVRLEDLENTLVLTPWPDKCWLGTED